MISFDDFNLSKQLQKAIADLGFETPTPVQTEAYSVVRSGKDVVGISQTGTGKTLAYMLPLLHDFKYGKEGDPRIVVLVPTRELVLQLVEQIESLIKYTSVRVVGVYGGVKMNTHKQAVAEGTDILVSTPARIYDLALCGALSLKAVRKLVIDEVDIMLDLGNLFQLKNIFQLLPKKRQNIMFSATMTEEVDELIHDLFVVPAKISIAVSGTPLENIAQQCYPVKNFNTKVNLLLHLFRKKDEFCKVLVFVANRKRADRLYEGLEEQIGDRVGLIHSGKTQNYRINAIEQFDNGEKRILVATDVMARGLDLDNISHVINFDTPYYPENYMHRIGRTGRAEQEGKAILLYTKDEVEAKAAIEKLMAYEIPVIPFPKSVDISNELIPEELPREENVNDFVIAEKDTIGKAFHEKKEKNKKTNQGGSYRRELAKKYKKPQSKGDKNMNRRSKKK